MRRVQELKEGFGLLVVILNYLCYTILYCTIFLYYIIPPNPVLVMNNTTLDHIIPCSNH